MESRVRGLSFLTLPLPCFRDATQPADEHMLFEAIPHRHTNRRDYEEWDIPKSMLSWLQADAATEGAWLHIIKGDTVRNAVAELVVRGDHLQMADPNFRHDLAA